LILGENYMTRYLQEELTTFWGRLTPYLALLESAQGDMRGPIGRVTIDTRDRQAFALHTTDTKRSDDASQIPTGQSATYTRLKTDDTDWGPWQREAYK
jgi:hypothetical protein